MQFDSWALLVDVSRRACAHTQLVAEQCRTVRIPQVSAES